MPLLMMIGTEYFNTGSSDSKYTVSLQFTEQDSSSILEIKEFGRLIGSLKVKGNSNYPTGMNLSKVKILFVSSNNESLKFCVLIIGLLYNDEFED